MSNAASVGRQAPRRAHATRRRGQELETAILRAAWSVLIERGYPGFTYEAIAARAKTSRPVLYRRWPERQGLLIDTLRRFWQPVPVPDTGTLRGDALAFLRAANNRSSRTISLLSVQLASYFQETDSSFSELRNALRPDTEPHPFDTIVERARARGELTAPLPSARIVNVAFDLLRHESLMNKHPTTDDVIEQIVDDVWLPLVWAYQHRAGSHPG